MSATAAASSNADAIGDVLQRQQAASLGFSVAAYIAYMQAAQQAGMTFEAYMQQQVQLLAAAVHNATATQAAAPAPTPIEQMMSVMVQMIKE